MVPEFCCEPSKAVLKEECQFSLDSMTKALAKSSFCSNTIPMLKVSIAILVLFEHAFESGQPSSVVSPS
jgi:hypothetical protein